jgi:hypothetical protein
MVTEPGMRLTRTGESAQAPTLQGPAPTYVYITADLCLSNSILMKQLTVFSTRRQYRIDNHFQTEEFPVS